MNLLRPNDQRARLAIILFIVIIILDIASFLADYVEYTFMAKIDDGITISDEKYELLEIVQGIFGLAYILIMILVIIMFLRWFRRAYYNLGKLTSTESTEGWAAGAWFIPFYNLYKPQRIMRELYDKTNRILKLNDPQYQRIETSLIGFWWALWIISNIGSNRSTRMYLRAETARDYMTSLSLSMPMSIVSIAAAILIILIIKKYASMEELLVQMKDKEDQISTI